MRLFRIIMTTLVLAPCFVLISGCSNKANISSHDMKVLDHQIPPGPMPASAAAAIAAQQAAYAKAHSTATEPGGLGPKVPGSTTSK